MSSRTRPAWSRTAAVLMVAALGACQTARSGQWVAERFEGLGYGPLYSLVLTTLDGQGYLVRHRDPELGEVETDWKYGTSRRAVRGPSRKKVLANIVPDAAGGFDVELRVVEEVIRKRGLLAIHVRESDDWESFGDDVEEAQFLMAKIRSVLALDGTDDGP